MVILLTGASSFTGYWFALELAKAGHHVIAPLRARRADYTGLRGDRVERLADKVEIVESCSFGDEEFLKLVRKVTVLCHHGAQVTDYKSLDFDVVGALRDNTRNVQGVLKAGLEGGLSAVVLTGSVFEEGEGAGSAPLRAFSPYGLSKGLTSDVFRFWCDHFGVALGKFIIANPFGPYEEPRFCHYLLQCWASGKSATVKTPAYVRDNIHVSLLARAYTNFVSGVVSTSGCKRLAPSGYVESQGAFSHRLAKEIGSRLNIACFLELLPQTEFPEPPVRISVDVLDCERLGWDDGAAWDELAQYYEAVFIGGGR